LVYFVCVEDVENVGYGSRDSQINLFERMTVV
jgi:hypothetical protein